MASAMLLGIMLFIRLSPIYQLVPIVVLLLIALILIVLEKAKKDKAAYKKIKK